MKILSKRALAQQVAAVAANKNNVITKLAAPSSRADAITKGYADAQLNELNNRKDKFLTDVQFMGALSLARIQPVPRMISAEDFVIQPMAEPSSTIFEIKWDWWKNCSVELEDSKEPTQVRKAINQNLPIEKYGSGWSVDADGTVSMTHVSALQ